MGVLRCGRKGCENIMCDRLSSEYGYICNDCFSELLNSNISIREFMQSYKHDLEKQYLIEMYNKEFKYIK